MKKYMLIAALFVAAVMVSCGTKAGSEAVETLDSVAEVTVDTVAVDTVCEVAE